LEKKDFTVAQNELFNLAD